MATLKGIARTGIPATQDEGELVDVNYDEFGSQRVLLVAPDGTDLITTDGVQVQGNIAHDVADSGNPVKIGGKAVTGAPSAVADGDRVDAHLDELGKQAVMIGADNGTNFVSVLNGNDDLASATDLALITRDYNLLYNGSNWDRARANIEITVLATAARTASTNSADLTNHNARGVIITLDVTTDPAGGETLQLLVQYKDAESSAYEIILDDAANATPGRRTVIVYPGTAGSANDVTSTTGYPLPRIWRVRIVHSAGGTWNYSVGASPIL